MARETIKLPAIDLSNLENKRRLISQVGALTGVYEVELAPKRDRRSIQQLAWYFGCIVHPLYEVMKAQDGGVTLEDAHEALKGRFLIVPVCHPNTGEFICNRVGSTKKFNTVQMADYCEHCRDFLAEWFNIIVPDPDPDWARAKSPSHGVTAG
jgi:hypothetical protein